MESPPRLTLKPHMIEVWCVRLHASQPTLHRARRVLSQPEEERADRFRFEDIRRSFILARACLRHLAAQFIGKDPQDVEFTYGDYGKPSFAHVQSRVRFNVSHSGALAAYAFVLDHELGIDIEELRPVNDMKNIARRFFYGAEYDDLVSLEESQRSEGFFRAWVQKEAYIKAVGGGLSIPLDSFRVSVLPQDAPALHRTVPNEQPMQGWRMHEFTPDAGYRGALALPCCQCQVRLHPLIDAEALLNADQR